ncbi:hypothetical protein RMSM_07239 [Rhodopirellula maiorica SM1]|uniref:Uncharacterized protein n=1 Tax=Rhodopirellula maiorica SM1 TaxID=1265738 RepID=M5R900_9BACT|nr:hypothetical protein [Rhodopirellula maiorica]EMI15840.1 hypothetical protein RMSM_07239 [Rhodopirellula maiorica SM1]
MTFTGYPSNTSHHRLPSQRILAVAIVMLATNAINDERHRQLKQMLHRIVSMLTRLFASLDVVAEPAADYDASVEYEYREAEYEYDEGKIPEPGRAPEDGLRGFTNGKSIVRPR